MKIFGHTFLRNCEASKFETWYTHRQMYRVYQNQAAAAYLSLYFFIFLSLQFSNIKIFLKNCEALKVETCYTHGQWVDVLCIPESGCCCLFVLFLSFFFLSNFQTLKFFITRISGTVRPRRLKQGGHWSGKSQGNLIFHQGQGKVREFCKLVREILNTKKVREKSGNFIIFAQNMCCSMYFDYLKCEK